MSGKEAINIINHIMISGSDSDVKKVAEAVEMATVAMKSMYCKCQDCKHESNESHCAACEYCLTSEWEKK